MGDIERVKRLVAYYTRLYGTRNPFRLNDLERVSVLAHELGHALLDRKANCYFIRNKTLLLNSRIERRANLFAAHLLIPSDMLREYEGHTAEQFSLCTGYPQELLDLRMQ